MQNWDAPSLGTILVDYWGKVSEKIYIRWLLTGVGVTYHKLHHFLTESTWSDYEINERRLEIMNKCSQTLVK